MPGVRAASPIDRFLRLVGALSTVLRCGCETVPMRNITVSVDDDTYRRSRIRAAELETSVSALVRGFLERLVREPPARAVSVGGPEAWLERRRLLLEEVVADCDARGVGLRMADNLSREELYDRGRARAEAAEAAGKHRGGPE